MGYEERQLSIRLKVGVFTLLVLLLMGAITVLVNDRPYWWRPCQLVHINIPDATGLKTKSPVRSLGLQIGYLKNVSLFRTHVRLGICITAPVEVLPKTQAFIKSEGFLGDKFVELKPVNYVGDRTENPSEPVYEGQEVSEKTSMRQKTLEPSPPSFFIRASEGLLNVLFPSAYAQTQVDSSSRGSREIPVGESRDMTELISKVDQLVAELTNVASNLKQVLDPVQLRDTINALNKTLENAATALAPEGAISSTTSRALGKLEDSIEQLRDILTRINQGKGSVGQLINDPKYAEEIMEALKSINRLLSKVSGMRFIVDIWGEYHLSYGGGRGGGSLGIWPTRDRYYLVGIGMDPRGFVRTLTTTTTSGGQSVTTRTEEVEENAIVFTAMFGKILWNRLNLGIGLLHNDGAARIGLFLGPSYWREQFQFMVDVYFRNFDSADLGFHPRPTAIVYPSGSPYLKNFYIKAGLETYRPINGRLDFFFGGGITFNDQEVKLLFAFL